MNPPMDVFDFEAWPTDCWPFEAEIEPHNSAIPFAKLHFLIRNDHHVAIGIWPIQPLREGEQNIRLPLVKRDVKHRLNSAVMSCVYPEVLSVV